MAPGHVSADGRKLDRTLGRARESGPQPGATDRLRATYMYAMPRELLALADGGAQRSTRVPLDVLLRVQAEVLLEQDGQALEQEDLHDDGGAGRLVHGVALLLDACD